MAQIDFIHALEELKPFQNEKGIIEIAIRGKNKRFKAFQKIALDQLQEGQNEVAGKIENAIRLLNKNNGIMEQSVKMLGTIDKLSKFNLVLNGLNLCATCVGFAIMYSKLDKISGQIEKIVETYKTGESIHVNYEYRKVLAEHSNMLDCRKTQTYYTKDQMRELVDGEYNVLELLIAVFRSDISNNKEDLLFSILSMAQMLSVSIRYFDELYYYEHKDAIGEGEKWHMSHDTWMSVYDVLICADFIEIIQDYGLFEMGLNTAETDYFYISFIDQIKSLKQDIEDNQKLIEAIDDKDLFAAVQKKTCEEVRQEIEDALKKADVPLEECENALRAATA